MILGGSHLTLASTDIEADLRALAGFGYAERFVERAMPSHPAKSAFLSRPYTSHDIAYAAAARGLAIELVRYGPTFPASVGSMVPIFDGKACVVTSDSGGAESLRRILADAMSATEATVARLPQIGSRACFLGGGKNARLVGVAIAVADLGAARDFWERGLGYHSSGEGRGWRRLTFRSPIEAWCLDVVLCQLEQSTHDAMLDSRGAACLSMVCTDLQQDRALVLAAAGHTPASTGPFDLVVDGRQLRMELFCGPDRVFVELFQVMPAQR